MAKVAFLLNKELHIHEILNLKFILQFSFAHFDCHFTLKH